MMSLFEFLSSSAVSAALLAILAYLARSWIGERLKSSIAHEYNSELEGVKTKLQIELEVFKTVFTRYSNEQFKLYNSLWASLCDLNFTVSDLWEHADLINLNKLSEQLKTTKKHVAKSALIIEERHYQELNQILDEFSNFQFGKQRLIELRAGKITRNQVPQDDINYTIQHNRQIKDRLEQYLSEMLGCLKRQISNTTIES